MEPSSVAELDKAGNAASPYARKLSGFAADKPEPMTPELDS